jgi:hypothetical protein
MDQDVDTFLTVVYCVCDDLYREWGAPMLRAKPGAKGKLSNSEMLALAALAQWEGHRCERCFLRYARTHWRAYFPGLTSQSAFNRRVRTLWAVLCRLGPALAAEVSRLLGQTPAYEVWDGVPVPLMRRCRGGRRRVFGEAAAGFGRGGADHDWYYGVHQWTAVTAQGAISGFVIGPAETAEYWLAEALLRWRADPTAAAPTAAELAPVLGPTHATGGARLGPTGLLGPRWGAGQPAAGPYLSDLGCAGRAWRAHWRATYGATVLTKADYRSLASEADQQAWTQWLCGLRQQAETAFNTLTDRLGITFPRARSTWAIWARLAAKVLAYNLLVYWNHLTGRPTFTYFNPLC